MRKLGENPSPQKGNTSADFFANCHFHSPVDYYEAQHNNAAA